MKSNSPDAYIYFHECIFYMRVAHEKYPSKEYVWFETAINPKPNDFSKWIAKSFMNIRSFYPGIPDDGYLYITRCEIINSASLEKNPPWDRQAIRYDDGTTPSTVANYLSILGVYSASPNDEDFSKIYKAFHNFMHRELAIRAEKRGKKKEYVFKLSSLDDEGSLMSIYSCQLSGGSLSGEDTPCIGCKNIILERPRFPFYQDKEDGAYCIDMELCGVGLDGSTLSSIAILYCPVCGKRLPQDSGIDMLKDRYPPVV